MVNGMRSQWDKLPLKSDERGMLGTNWVMQSAFIKCELVNGRNFYSILGAKACERLNLIEVKDSDAMNPLPGEATKTKICFCALNICYS